MCRPAAYRFLGALLSAVPMLSGWAVAESPPSVRGRITDPAGAPLEGATAELRPVLSNFEWGRRTVAGETVDAPVARTQLDGDGRFSLAAPGAGVWELVVRAEGFVPMRYTPLPLTADRELPPVALRRDAGTEVRVRNARGEPAAGIRIFADSAAHDLWRPYARVGWTAAPRIGESDGQGMASLPRAPSETLRIHAVVPGWARDVRIECAERGEIGLPALEGRTEVTVEVRDPDGRPLPGVLISAGSPPWPVGATDDGGRLRRPAGLAGDLPLHLFTADGQRAAAWLKPAGDRLPATVRVELPAASTLSGRVVAAAGRSPIAGALVWPGHDPGTFAVSDAEGAWRLSGAFDRPFWVQAEATGFVPRARTLGPPLPRPSRPATFALTSAARLEGRVTDRAGKPLANVHLAVTAHAPTPRPELFRTDPALGRAASDGSGRFAIDGLSEGGTYEVTATRLGWMPAVRTVPRLRAARAAGGAPLRITLEPSRPVRGKVVAAQGRPIAGAKVRLRATADAPALLETPLAGIAGDPFTAVSNPQGLFILPAAPASRFDVGVRRRGFAGLELRDVEAVPGEGPIELGSLVLPVGGGLSGVVVASGGSPLAGARIWALEDPGRPPPARPGRFPRHRPDAASGGDGRFEVADLTPGRRYHLLVQRQGSVPASVAGVEVPTAEPVRITLTAAGEVAGRVVQASGEPVAGAEVRLRPRPPQVGVAGEERLGPEAERAASSGEDGTFRIVDTLPGVFELTARAAGFRPAPRQLLTLAAGAAVEGLELVVTLGARLFGEVTSAGGEPLAAARVLVGDAFAASDEDGFYRLDGIPPGEHEVTVDHEGFDLSRRTLEISAGSQRADFVLSGGWPVRGRVEDGGGEPVEGARVELARQAPGGAKVYQAMTGADGRFEIRQAADGTYRATAFKPGFVPPEAPPTAEVDSAPIEDLVLRLVAGGVVRGRVLGLPPEELPRVRVSAESSRWGAVEGRVGFAGSYRISGLGTADWWLVAAPPDGSRQVRERIRIAGGETLEKDLEFRAGLVLSGSVRFDGVPAAGARVAVSAAALGVRRSVTVDHRGFFRCADLQPGRYRLTASLEVEDLHEDLDLELTEDRELTIDLRTTSVAGRVIAADTAEPLADVRVVAEKLVEDAPPGSAITVATDGRGTFRIRRVVAGTYRLRFARRGYLPRERVLELAAGLAEEGLEAALDPTAGFSVRVRLASGRPLRFATVAVVGPGGLPEPGETQVLDGDGQALFFNVPPAATELLVSAPDAAAVRARSGTETTLDLVLPDAARLTVRVPELRDDLGATASVAIAGAGGRRLETLDVTGVRSVRWPLVRGVAEVDGVPAGSWTVRVESSDGRSWAARAATSGSHDVSLDLE